MPSMRYPDDDDDRYDRYDDDDDQRYRRPRRRKRRPHSELGIASCVIAILAGGGVFVTVVTAGVMMARDGDMSDSRAMAVGGVTLTGGGLALIGVGLGLVGVLQERRKKIF